MQNWIWNWSVNELLVYSFILNTFVFWGSLTNGFALQKIFEENQAYPLFIKSISGIEIILATATVIINTIVMIAGWFLWKQGWIYIQETTSILTAFFDSLVLFFTMDAFMYWFHRVAHIEIIFNFVHKLHHQFDKPQPITLFVLNPLETIGFGGLWLFLICIYPSSLIGMILYLIINTFFGLVGHIGVEPYLRNWLRIPFIRNITTSTFHILHHKTPQFNFGFYTSFWDNWFHTLHPDYQKRFELYASKAKSKSND